MRRDPLIRFTTSPHELCAFERISDIQNTGIAEHLSADYKTVYQVLLNAVSTRLSRLAGEQAQTCLSKRSISSTLQPQRLHISRMMPLYTTSPL